MKKYSLATKMFIQEVTEEAKKLKVVTRGLPIGALIRSFRQELGMSQKELAKRAGVPQSTISRVEQGRDTSLSTLQKILSALSCDLVIAPLLRNSLDTIRHEQARKVAEKQVRYMSGTMNLEDQQPDDRFIEELLNQEKKRLLDGPNYKLWEDK
jgi:predicted DNA-binding mobile mystery protein A